MRPLFIVLGAEGVEAPLLRREVAGGRSCGFGFERPVHALVSSVLLGVRELDELGVDAELDPPGGELGDPADRARRERCPVVRADDIGQAELLEDVGHGLLSVLLQWT